MTHIDVKKKQQSCINNNAAFVIFIYNVYIIINKYR